ncbi:DUF4349 domain-containing protein [Patescibacteria group bacterium]
MPKVKSKTKKMLKDKTKKIIKVVLIIFGVFVVFNILSFFSGETVETKKTSTPGDYSMQFEENLAVEGMDDLSGVPPTRLSESKAVASNVVVDKKVIKSGSLKLKVKSTEDAANQVGDIVKNQGGEVFSTNFYEKVKGQRNGFITVKVPVVKFEDTIDKLKGIATQVMSESTTGQDVTERYSDLQIQLRNKKAEEESFVKILDRAGKIDDVLATTKQIARVRNEIERLEGRVRFMDSQAEMSTIVVYLNEDIEVAPISEDWRIGQVFKDAFSEFKNVFQGFVNGLIRFVIVGIPSLTPLVLITWFVYWVGKKFSKKIGL